MKPRQESPTITRTCCFRITHARTDDCRASTAGLLYRSHDRQSQGSCFATNAGVFRCPRCCTATATGNNGCWAAVLFRLCFGSCGELAIPHWLGIGQATGPAITCQESLQTVWGQFGETTLHVSPVEQVRAGMHFLFSCGRAFSKDACCKLSPAPAASRTLPEMVSAKVNGNAAQHLCVRPAPLSGPLNVTVLESGAFLRQNLHAYAFFICFLAIVYETLVAVWEICHRYTRYVDIVCLYIYIYIYIYAFMCLVIYFIQYSIL